MSEPFFSVVVPTRDRPSELARCLAALASLRTPSDRYEVIVVDDGSRQPLDDVANSFRGRMALTLLVQPNRGPGAARNRGMAAARGDIIAFTDDDCTPDADWLARFSDRLAAGFRGGLGGRTVNALPHNRYSSASQHLIDYLYAYFNSTPGRVPLFASNNLALPAGSLRALGGFDERFGAAAAEDRDLCRRWYDAGHGLAYVPDAIVGHAHDLDLRGFLRQHFHYGRGALRYHSLRDGRGHGSIEPWAFYRDLVLHPFAREVEKPLVLSALLALSQAANAAGFFSQLLASRR